MKRKCASTKSIFKYERSECPVCMEEMCVESRSVTSPCMHEFCLECIGKWLTESSSSLCPLCKQSVKIIIYNIRTPSNYSRINFPKGFNNAWLLRNKTKNILDNFENILFKIYDTIRTFIYGKKMAFDIKILDYLIYFGSLLYRPKSSSNDDCLTPFEVPDDEICWGIVENLVSSRLKFLFSDSYSVKIMKKITDKSCFAYGQFVDILEKYLDPVRFVILKSEIATYLQMSRDPSIYLEYYVPGCHEHIIFSKDTLLDESVTSAIITRIITSINFETPNMIVAGYQISNIDHIFALLEYICSYEKLLSHLAFASYYILMGSNFYSSTALKKEDSNMCPITISTCDLIKHCFRDEELDHIAQTLSRFEERLIFFEPYVVDDSNLSDIVLDETEPCENIYIELSDSDDDALEIISINQPVFDLTESVSSVDHDCYDGVATEDVPTKRQKTTAFPGVQWSDDDNDTQCVEVVDRCPVAPTESPTTSTTSTTPLEVIVVDVTTPPVIETVPLSIDSDLSGGSVQHIDCPSRVDGQEEKNVDFIYQPRSVNDFYEYLMSRSVPDT